MKVYREIQRRRLLCRDAEEKFDRQLESKSDVSDSTAAEDALAQHEPAAARRAADASRAAGK
jgi:hypothetical protein